jgi:hypothetical protein
MDTGLIARTKQDCDPSSTAYASIIDKENVENIRAASSSAATKERKRKGKLQEATKRRGSATDKRRKQEAKTHTRKKKKTLTNVDDQEEEEGNDDENENGDNKLYCVCKQPYQEGQEMIACDSCDDWFHFSCINLPKTRAKKIDKYICPLCEQNGREDNTTHDEKTQKRPTTPKRKKGALNKTTKKRKTGADQANKHHKNEGNDCEEKTSREENNIQNSEQENIQKEPQRSENQEIENYWEDDQAETTAFDHNSNYFENENDNEKDKEPEKENEDDDEHEDADSDQNENPDESAVDDEDNEFERARLQRIQENQALLQSLGLNLAKQSFAEAMGKATPKRYKGRVEDAEFVPDEEGDDSFEITHPMQDTLGVPTRRSRRLSKEPPLEFGQILETVKAERKIRDADMPRMNYNNIHRSFRGCTRLPGPDTILTVPLTLPSIGTTIWSLGEIVVGPDAKRYWSNRQCLFKHPYPLGYRASRTHFGKEWIMKIERGEKGPLFVVEDEEEGQRFTGNTPTHPWTKACIASPSPGTRVSGPLLFGFSDPLTQRLLEQLLERSKADSITQSSSSGSSSSSTSSTSSVEFSSLGSSSAIEQVPSCDDRLPPR